MCDHSSVVNTDYYTQICTNCGLELQVGHFPCSTDIGTNAPLRISCYLRNKRFQNQLECVVMPLHASFPKSITMYLLKQHAPYKTIRSLIQQLKSIQGPKSYIHLHYYCINFLENYTPMPVVCKQTRYDIVSFFMKVENRFLSNHDTAFFSYPWLLIKLLNMFGLQKFTPYVKNISCRKRVAKYDRLWKSLTLDVMFK